MNVVLAVGLLTGLYMVKYQKVVDADSGAVIGSVAPNTPAAKAGIQEGDRIVKLDGKRNPTWDDIILKEVESASRPMHLTIRAQWQRIRYHRDARARRALRRGHGGLVRKR
jgi:regulator of sigma E protease